MLQTLLEERFALKVRMEMSTGDMLTLVWPGATAPSVRRSRRGAAPVPRSCPRCISRRRGDRCRTGRLRRRMIQPWRNVPPVIERVGYHSMASRCPRRRGPFAAAGAGVTGHDRGRSNRPERPLHDGVGLPVSCAASSRSCCSSGLRPSLLVHRRSGAMGIAAGAGQGAVQTRRGRKRATAFRKLIGKRRAGDAEPAMRRRTVATESRSAPRPVIRNETVGSFIAGQTFSRWVGRKGRIARPFVARGPGSIARIEAVCPVPVPIHSVWIRRCDIDTSVETGELACSVRERAQSETGLEFDCATADCSVSLSCVKDDVTVLQTGWNTWRLILEDS